MAGFVLPLLGYGATALGAGAAGVSLYSGYEDLKDKYTKKAYETGPDLKGNFDTGSPLGNLIVGEETQEFKDNYIPTARRKDAELNQMITLLGDKFQRGDGTQTIQQLKDLNMPAAQLAKQEQELKLEQNTTKYKREEQDRRKEEKRYNDTLMQMQQTRLDNLNLQRMQMQREDQRYNERLDREERNRRQESVMAMMAGLTSLGAAFA